MVTYLALVLAAAALVAHLIWGQWFYGALVAGWPPPSRRFGDPPPPPNPRDPDRD